MEECWGELKTHRLILRAVEEADAVDLMVVFGNQSMMIGNSVAAPVLDIDELLSVVRKQSSTLQAMNDSPFYVLERASDGKVIGVIYFNSLQNGCGDIAYFIAKRYQRCGYMSEALIALMEHFFGDCHLKCLTASYAKENTASARLLHNCGFQSMPQAKSMMLNDHKYHLIDTCYLKQEEWCER